MAAPDDLEQLVQPGQVLAGKYRIERILGKGGMGVVVAAHHLQLDEKVAIKFLLPAAVARADLLARFEREARAAVKIKSEHVARVIDVGVLESGSPFMVMEYLEGMDLSARIASDGRLSVVQTADWVLQACEAIVEAHALGIVHRDLKPANLFVTRGADGLESIKVLDFGISKSSAMSGSGASDMTQTQSMLGSPFYMSPEQMQSARTVDMRTDIWSLGCIIYQCVTGEVPFEAETLPELVLKIVQGQPRPIQQFRPDVPPAFEQVISYCLQKNRDQRYQHIGDLATGLVPFAPERARASAERILRVVHTSGIAHGVQPKLPPSSSNMEAAKLATFKVQAVNLAPQGTDSSPTGPGGMPVSSNLHDSRPSAFGPAPSGVGGVPSGSATVGMGPPPNTLPPGAKSASSNRNFGVTSSSGTWGNTSSHSAAGVPKSSSGTMALAIIGAVIVIVLLGGGAFFAGRRIFAAQHGDGHPDAATSSAPIATAGPSSMPSATPHPVATETPEPEVPEAADAGMVAATAHADAGPGALVLTPIPQPAPQPGPVAHPPPGPGPTPQAPTGKAPAAGCTPPYYYDSSGNKVFKKECI